MRDMAVSLAQESIMRPITTTTLFLAFLILPRHCCGDTNYAIDFNRDIRPLLADTCFKCHGPDAHDRQADLRLDTAEGIEHARELIAAADPVNSELLRRVFSTDSDEVMPPADSGRVLTDEQKSLLKQWVEQGAKWEPHWSFVKPEWPRVPQNFRNQWPTNEIDQFVLRKLDNLSLSPNPIADRLVLIRRLSLDLTGLPPTPELIEKYTSTVSSRWYEELVEELFHSPHYGEHMARFWLDAARYADTHGLHLDNYREMWLYRDWVINAFNINLPFDQFVTHQLAGDLLPSPTEPQLIATGFNRAHVTTNEGGSIKQEVLVRNVVDRVATTGTVFMGLTIGCAQCHDHKYDPITQEDFYSLYAFFNSLDADPMDGNRKDHAPILRFFDAQAKQDLEKLNVKKAELTEQINRIVGEFKYVDPVKSVADVEPESEAKAWTWLDDELPKTPKKQSGWTKVGKEKFAPFSGESTYVIETTEFQQSVLQNATHPLRFNSGDLFFVNVYLDPDNPPKQVMVQYNDGNWDHRAYWGENLISFGIDGTTSRKRLGDLPETGKWVRLEIPAAEVGFKGLAAVQGIAFSQHGGKAYWDNAGVVTRLPQRPNKESYIAWRHFQKTTGASDLPKRLKERLLSVKKQDESVETDLRDYYLRNVNPQSVSLIEAPTKELQATEKGIQDKTRAAPTTLIWKEKSAPVKAHILNRGEYDQLGDEVLRRTPESLPAFSPELSNDRLGLAQWLLSDQHPLTARVAVNRIWQQFFGMGIVGTSEDFGAQGELPTHPELLDWLALSFVKHGWDIKHLVKTIVMSSAYRQSTRATAAKLKLDPANRFLSRGPRFRLDAETLRDQALAVSHLLVPTVGGPAVKPPQPSGLWYAVGYSGSNTVRFKADAGHQKVHRRSLYTFWKRTAPPPQMSTLDAPSRESCIVRRERTNTPLQALLLMNDPQFVEAARFLAQRTLDQNHKTIEEDVRFMYEAAMARPIDSTRQQVLLENLKANLGEFVKSKEQAKLLLSIGENSAAETYDVVQLASLTMLANLIMNQDEFLTKN